VLPALNGTQISFFLAACCVPLAAAIRPSHNWDTLSGMSFFHACNESGPFSERALDTIEKFPLVTVEKGQGFHEDCSAYVHRIRVNIHSPTILQFENAIQTCRKPSCR
jgi:hypothetical protein